MFGNIGIVFRAEFMRRVRSRPFIVGLLVGALGIAGLAKLQVFVNSQVPVESSHIVLAGDPALTYAARSLLTPSFTVVAVRNGMDPPSSADLQASGAGMLLGLTSDGRGLHVATYAINPASVDAGRIARLLFPLDVQIAAHVNAETARRLAGFRIEIHNVGPSRRTIEQQRLARAIAFALIFFLYMLVILNSQLTMASVIEEKTNRIAELLVASVDPIALLYGKILAGASLGLLQMAIWMIAGLVAAVNSVHPAAGAPPPTALGVAGAFSGALGPKVMVAFVFALLIGLLQFSTLFAGIGSLISRPEDLGSISLAMVFPIVAALVIAMIALVAADAPVVVATSFLPLLAPFTMFARVAAGQPPGWQIALAVIINVVALLGIAVLAGKLYRVGMLLYGRPPSLRQVWTTIRR